ncbi:amidophosphoribosyltransferase [Desulfofustis glycolicus]|uniref:Amidophosphoribosyltransferase n=1 Tax=Desulfofustis glycolicus DSM 9705 TaxID=1121409 RepID=A0A1M5YF60_9BACT|nr:amidophosphoribosyltransferase [Desulfofustis glycolicus]MCB2216927.1 amidophosphoribosyltransferase [Desulfobulbaceae bacterium]SHI10163.1 amidophosphoribosyltransferase [Desulfofustis glycolicus DSM 9705]
MNTQIPAAPSSAVDSLRPTHECGVCGIYDHHDAAKFAYFGLYALQHRGQESAGIVTSNGKQVYIHKNMGLVPEVFSEEILSKLAGDIAIGHVRYSTTGASTIINTQPLLATHKGTSLAVAHNGNLVNSVELRRELEMRGSIFQTTMDSEVVLHLMAHASDNSFEEALRQTLTQLKGAFSMVMMSQDALIAVRDPNGFRPLCLGKLPNGGYIVASETCALDLVEAAYLRDIAPGEVLICKDGALHSIYPWPARRSSFCIFESVYFARPDSDIFGINVYQTRKRMGQMLARECRIDGDFVMPFPDSGNYAAIGYSQESGLPLEFGVIRNHYVGRTFIQPTQSMRDFNVRVKLNPVRSFLTGKRVIIIEDSIIRGTTGKSRVRSLRDAGAKEVHMLVSCPPTRYPCFYGIDFPSCKELIASGNDVPAIADYLGLDSLYYLSLEGMVAATGMAMQDFCLACFNADYPVPPDRNFHKDALAGCGS